MNRLILLVVLIWLPLLNGKTLTHTFKYRQLAQSKWLYLTKFQSDIGVTEYDIKFRLISPNENKPLNQVVKMQFEVYLDEDWHNGAEQMDQCARQPIAKIRREMWVGKNAGEISGKLSQSQRPHVWFFAISDCENAFLKEFPNQENIKIEVTMHMTQDNQSEFSMEDKGSLNWVGLLSLIEVGLLIMTLQYCWSDFKRNEEWDWPVIVLSVILLLETLQNTCQFGHLLVYAKDGSGLIGLKIISEILQVISNFMLTSLLIMISWGWSIKYIEVESVEVYVPLAVVVGFLQVTFMALGKMNDDMHHNYHPYDSGVGWGIGLVELGLFIYFIQGIIKSKQTGSTKVQNFVQGLGFFGSLYFLGFPLLLLLSKVIAQYLRYKLIMIGTNAMRIIAIIALSRLFTSKTTGYHEISYKNRTFIDRTKLE